MGPLSRLVGKPPLSPWVSADFLPLTQVVNNTNSAIPLTEIFDRVFSDVCNSLGFEVQKQKKRGSGNNRVYRNLNVSKCLGGIICYILVRAMERIYILNVSFMRFQTGAFDRELTRSM